MAVAIGLIAVSLLALALAAHRSGVINDRPDVHTGYTAPAVKPEIKPPELPKILSDEDAVRYRRIFALQRLGHGHDAKQIAARIENPLLMGHVLAQRLQRMARPSPAALRNWLRDFPDHPDYKHMHALAVKRHKRSARKSIPPLKRHNVLATAPERDPPYVSKKRLNRNQRRRISRIKKAARIWLRRGQIVRTEKLLRRGYVVRLLDRYEMDEARAMIAAAWFYRGNDSKSYRFASKALARSGRKLPLTHWIAGLAAWRLGKIDTARRHFETLAGAPGMSGWIRAGAAYWAARAHTRLGKDGREEEGRARRWRQQAARHPYTLYGVMALAELGRDLPFEARHRPLTVEKAALIASTGGGRRALALNQSGEKGRAEQELLALREWNQPGMADALRAVADHLTLPAVALRLARHQAKDRVDGRADEPLDPTLYPTPPWVPEAGSGIDRALLYAFMRQESDFNPYALSPAGALGLMQIMPRTARYMNKGKRFRGARRLDPFDPDINVTLGQRYLSYLRVHRNVRDDLLRMIASYNSGPGNIGYWTRKRIRHGQDPLLFVEAIPNLETRLFVRRVLANLWIYRTVLGQPAPSLGAMIAGEFPRYKSID